MALRTIQTQNLIIIRTRIGPIKSVIFSRRREPKKAKYDEVNYERLLPPIEEVLLKCEENKLTY